MSAPVRPAPRLGDWKRWPPPLLRPLCIGRCGAPVPPGALLCTSCTRRLPEHVRHQRPARQHLLAVAYYRIHGGD